MVAEETRGARSNSASPCWSPTGAGLGDGGVEFADLALPVVLTAVAVPDDRAGASEIGRAVWARCYRSRSG